MKKAEIKVLLLLFIIGLVGCKSSVIEDEKEIKTSEEIDAVETKIIDSYLEDGTLFNPFLITVSKVEYFEEIDYTVLELNERSQKEMFYDFDGNTHTPDELVEIFDKYLENVGYYYIELTFQNVLDYKIDYFSGRMAICEGSNVNSDISCSRNYRSIEFSGEEEVGFSRTDFISFYSILGDQFKLKEEKVPYYHNDKYTIFNGVTVDSLGSFEPGESRTVYLIFFRQNTLKDTGITLNIGTVSNVDLDILDEKFYSEHKIPMYDEVTFEYYGAVKEGETLVSYESER